MDGPITVYLPILTPLPLPNARPGTRARPGRRENLPRFLTKEDQSLGEIRRVLIPIKQHRHAEILIVRSDFWTDGV